MPSLRWARHVGLEARLQFQHKDRYAVLFPLDSNIGRQGRIQYDRNAPVVDPRTVLESGPLTVDHETEKVPHLLFLVEFLVHEFAHECGLGPACHCLRPPKKLPYPHYTMRPAQVLEIVTPKKFVLDGLLFGSTNAKRAIILVHGLTSSAFSLQHVVGALVDKETAVITFNNRGFKSVVDIKQRLSKKETKWRIAGSAHEVFTECVDDIQGAVNLARKARVKEVYLAGHSTGCQKSIYWASKTGGKGVKGIILLAPLSDYASEKHFDTGGRMRKATALARKLVKAKKPHELLPRWASPIMLLDAQRYLSLYTPESSEEIFTYGQPGKRSRTYESVKLPVLALFADKDEHSDRPAERLAEWFATNTRSRYFRAGIVPKVGHSFRGGEKRVAELVRGWLSGMRNR